MDDLYTRFLPLFLTLARSRVALAISTAAQRDEEAAIRIARELHDVAGEAGLLGLKEVVPIARDCEEKAKQLRTTRAEADAEELVAALRQLERVIEGVSKA